MIFGAKINIIQVNQAYKNSQKPLLFWLKNSISEFGIFLKIEFLNTIRDFLTVCRSPCSIPILNNHPVGYKKGKTCTTGFDTCAFWQSQKSLTLMRREQLPRFFFSHPEFRATGFSNEGHVYRVVICPTLHFSTENKEQVFQG